LVTAQGQQTLPTPATPTAITPAAPTATNKKVVEPPLAGLLPSEQAWLVTLPFPPSGPGAMDDQRVYVPMQGEHFIALERETGETAWTVDVESDWTPLVHDGVVYIAASDELHALDAATGDYRWRVPLGRGPMAALAWSHDAIVALVAPDEVWAINPADGQRVWGQSLGGSVGTATMAVDADRIFVAIGSRLVRLDRSNGKVRWERTLPGVLSAPAVARDRVFVGSTSNALYAVDQSNGNVAWSFRVGGDVLGSSADKDVVYVASLDNVLRALKRGNGNQLWKRALTTRPAAPPRAFGGIVAVPGISPPLATFNAKTGAPIATFDALGGLLRAKFVPPTLMASTLKPYTVSLVFVTSDGRATGHRSLAMLFRENPLQPLIALPGRPLTREPLELPSRR
jgi:outer membrane protein assembly factor BamB